jgi:hypothetical protein
MTDETETPAFFKTYQNSPPANGIKLALSICSNRPMEPRCALSLAMMVHHLTAFGVPFAIISRMQASLLPQARQDCMDEAIGDGCTHQLWWDDDVEAPGDAPLRMIQALHNHPEVDVVAVNYCRKQDTLQYTAEDLDGNMIESKGKIGLQEAAKIGLGLAMVRLEKLASVPRPHFEVAWDEKYQAYQGEDRYFTKKLLAYGLKIFVDHGISNWVQHWGSIGYSFNLWNKENQSIPDINPAAVRDKS